MDKYQMSEKQMRREAEKARDNDRKQARKAKLNLREVWSDTDE